MRRTRVIIVIVVVIILALSAGAGFLAARRLGVFGPDYSPHFRASIHRLKPDTFRVDIRPVSSDSKTLMRQGAQVHLYVRDENGVKVTDSTHQGYGLEHVDIEYGPAGRDDAVRWESHTFVIRPDGLPEGRYTVNPSVELWEVGPGAVRGGCWLCGIAVKSTNQAMLIVQSGGE